MSDVPIVVVAAVIEEHGRFLVTQRAAGGHLAGCWEFPGGKLEPGESFTDALRREMLEELDVDIEVGKELDRIEHAYPDRVVRLHFYRCRLKGEPRSSLNQSIRWVERRKLAALEFPPADAALIVKLVKMGTETP